MSKQNETGHAKTVANFRVVLAACQGYGATYNPSRTELTVTELISRADAGETILDNVRSAFQVEKDAINARETPFKLLSKLGTRIINGLGAFNASQKVIDDARFLVNKLTGRRAASGSAATPTNPTNTISVSQMSYDMRVDSFEKLVKLVEAQASYAPNEVEMQVATLKTHAQTLKTLNNSAVTARIALDNARIARDKALYSDVNSICNIALDVKKYVKYLYGATAAEYKQISSLSFSKRI